MREAARYVRVVLLLFLGAVCAIAQTPPTQGAGIGATTPSEPTTPFKVVNGISAPRVIYAPDPVYTEKARKAHIEGRCLLWLIVGSDGVPRNIKVQRSLGHGLDESAVEAVSQWRFDPALKDGQPVAVQINVDVTFKLSFGTPPPEIQLLEMRAYSGDAKAELKLSQIYLEGKGVTKDENLGRKYLERAANRGLPKAQFQMAEYATTHGEPDGYISAYMWYSIAARNKYKNSEKRLEKLASMMSPQDIAEAQRRAQDWQPSNK